MTVEPDAGSGPATSWTRRADAELAALAALGRRRATRVFDAAGPAGSLAGGRRAVVSFASNDYLGLTQHPTVKAAARAAIDRWGTGSGSARLVVGSRPVHADLEAALAEWKGADRVLCFSTGYQANLGVCATIAGPDALVCSDELNHASLIDGCRLSRAEVAVYGHRDVSALADLLARRHGRPAVVVSDSVFSMDGDLAPVNELVEVCASEDALLVLDEAHAVLGPPAPSAAAAGAGVELVRVGTLSKTLGSIGGFVAGSSSLVELLENRARAFVFTTAPTPADAAAALAALGVLHGDEGGALVARLRSHVERVAPGHPSPIVPIVCGDDRAALEASDALLTRGLLVPAIRPPTVAPGTSRLRIALSAAHTDEQLDALVGALDDLGLR